MGGNDVFFTSNPIGGRQSVSAGHSARGAWWCQQAEIESSAGQAGGGGGI